MIHFLKKSSWVVSMKCVISSVHLKSDISWVSFAMKAAPLSLWMAKGNLNLGIISFKRAWITSEVFSDQQGKASAQPVKVSINTSKYQKLPDALGIIAKSVSLSSTGSTPLSGSPLGGGGPSFLLFLAQMVQLSIIFY